ncbi:MAG: hypothetical protein A3F13_04785 [Gammaproteobacteria bacterium RIFCSPHIGHO2_12_FULL_40_19]|nr:MAG: hypothetical protein A3F13_04785 [Gammaproteobacteria bacterium RIFCSPHIGHO2_12_FULL_40_19]
MKHAIRGGTVAHVARRLFHAAMIVVPFFYYYYLIDHASQKILRLSILAFIFLVFLFEKFRIRARLVLFGQRLHEASHISTFAWTMLSLGMVLFFAPVDFAMPIVTCCAFVDPMLGEMRLHQINKVMTFLTGVFVALMIWLVCAWFYHFPLWYGAIIAPITVLVEWPSLKWIDDNALMLLVPLLVVSVIHSL